MKKKIRKLSYWADREEEKEQKRNFGPRTVICKNQEEFEKVFEEFNNGMISPGGAADKLHVSRSYIHQLEREGKIRVYRVWDEDLGWDDLPLWVKIITPRKGMYIMIPTEDIERLKKDRIKKAEETIKKLKE
jgi:hypothetical protein